MTMLVADKRYCLDRGGKVVDCDSAEAASLLVAEGSQMSEADAAKYGLKLSGPPEPLSAVDQARADLNAALARGGEEEARLHRDRLVGALAEAGTPVDEGSAEGKAEPQAADKAKKAPPENKGG